MKKYIGIGIMVIFLTMCGKRKVVETPPPPPPPQVEEEVKEEVPERPPLVLQMINFDFDKYDIRPGDAEILKKNAEILKLYPEVNVIIEGHTCDIGTEEYNMGLGERRAKAARDYLVKLGIDPNKLSIISYGETRLLDPKNKPINRRAEFKVK